MNGHSAMPTISTISARPPSCTADRQSRGMVGRRNSRTEYGRTVLRPPPGVLGIAEDWTALGTAEFLRAWAGHPGFRLVK
ncbi:DUF6368 family protein [Streptomyces europaeiscabiei]|uniref:DUF6368 family protein n=1 Tax=Streptomyces europaeiscabiei TaxID=146819 RepID=UPI00399B2AA3